MLPTTLTSKTALCRSGNNCAFRNKTNIALSADAVICVRVCTPEGTVIYRRKASGRFGRAETPFDPMDFLARLLMHIPQPRLPGFGLRLRASSPQKY